MKNIYQKPVDELTFTDDGMFQAVMHEPKICAEIIERLLHIKVGHIDYPELEKTIAPYYTSKGIRMDVYLQDSNRVIDVEMQNKTMNSLGNRMRYYQSMIDIDTLIKGQDYSDLKESYIVFICKKDPFRDLDYEPFGLPCYTFKNICAENDNVELDDKTTKVVYNASAYERAKDPWLHDFLQYVYTDISGDDAFSNSLSAMIEKIKKNENFRGLYLSMNLHDRDLKKEAMEEGALQKAIEAALVLIKDYNVPPEVAAEKMKAPLQKVLELQNQIKEKV